MSKSYRNLITAVDELAATLSSCYSKHLVCRSGCSGCCQHHLSVFPVEASAIRETFTTLAEQVRFRIIQQAKEVEVREVNGEPVACPMLLDDRCASYGSRPVICRTQGLPLLYENDRGEEEVDFCPLNFTAPEAINDLDEERLVRLDDLNLRLALVNWQYCQEQGIEKSASGERVKMSVVILDARY
jgi:Fe-S-cluster containining protein